MGTVSAAPYCSRAFLRTVFEATAASCALLTAALPTWATAPAGQEAAEMLHDFLSDTSMPH